MGLRGLLIAIVDALGESLRATRVPDRRPLLFHAFLAIALLLYRAVVVHLSQLGLFGLHVDLL